ncbi:hypothetical protein CYMTET_47499 [Cymbomonas tetramitiformis]|uniref:Uncharacterized protein n=1 Tax=Cymbomonas tetramitiformis TaxID=36881 RepID=A0AAE0EVX8_9CHLO|nr:hypothetical protein CYMTET_47499 [Cymbomonas tetramitiformis]
MLATTLVEQPAPSLDVDAPAPRMVTIEDRVALRHAVRQEAQAHQVRYQDRYDDTQVGKCPKLQVGDAVLLRRTSAVMENVIATSTSSPI